MKVCFRPHRGGFKEAMEAKSEFHTVGKLKQFLSGRPIIEYYSRDTRLCPNSNGDTFIITDAKHVIGFM